MGLYMYIFIWYIPHFTKHNSFLLDDYSMYRKWWIRMDSYLFFAVFFPQHAIDSPLLPIQSSGHRLLPSSGWPRRSKHKSPVPSHECWTPSGPQGIPKTKKSSSHTCPWDVTTLKKNWGLRTSHNFLVLFELEFLWVNGFVGLFSLIAGLEFSGVSSSSNWTLLPTKIVLNEYIQVNQLFGG